MPRLHAVLYIAIAVNNHLQATAHTINYLSESINNLVLLSTINLHPGGCRIIFPYFLVTVNISHVVILINIPENACTFLEQIKINV